MGVSDPIPNQANFQDSQNFQIDIDKIYSDFIKEIDANRSIVNIQINQSVLKVLDIKTIASLNAQLKVESTPQESRTHTFYRLIGFPVVDVNKGYYNPGLDTIQDSKKKKTLADKITIANHPLTGFKVISLQRENYLNSILSVFAVTPPTITSTAFALTSGPHVRSFAIPVTNDDPYDFATINQSYTADFRSLIGKNDQVLLTDYVDELGNKPDIGALRHNRFHFIKPFIVDPRIDFSVNPASRRVAVPFVLNKSNLLIGEDTFVKRPLLEKVIRERFSVQDQVSTTQSAGKSIIDYILSVPAVKDEKIIQQMASGDIYKLGEQLQFLKYFNIIKAMCVKLVEAQKKIQIVQSRYYWLPLPSTIGPEGSSSIKGIIISKELPDGDNNSFITTADRSVISATLNQAANQFNAQTASADGTPDIGGFAFEAFKTTFDQDTSQSFGDEVTNQLDLLNKKRDHDLAIANQALRTIEIIMGEFSGLGLCDIIAVMGALYIMPKDDLLGFLDADAFNRMLVALNFPGLDTSNPGIDAAQTSFIAKVKDFYNLMDKIYQDLAKNNGLST